MFLNRECLKLVSPAYVTVVIRNAVSYNFTCVAGVNETTFKVLLQHLIMYLHSS